MVGMLGGGSRRSLALEALFSVLYGVKRPPSLVVLLLARRAMVSSLEGAGRGSKLERRGDPFAKTETRESVRDEFID
jgi:hypothetical protein